MNNSKIWLVVNPTVGVPLFLGAVALGSFSVHVAVMQNTGWIDQFLSGQEMASVVIEGEEQVQTASFTSVDGEHILVTMPDGTLATAVLTPEQSARLVTD